MAYEEYKNAINDYKNGAIENANSPITPKTANSGVSDYSKMLETQNYKQLLDAEIQANISKDRAMKYTNQAMQNNGYGTQGLSESSRVGAYNNYANALASAKRDYEDRAVANYDKVQEQMTEDVNYYNNYLLSAENQDELDFYYNKIDKSQLDDRALKQLQMSYDYAKYTFDKANNQTVISNDNSNYTWGEDGNSSTYFRKGSSNNNDVIVSVGGENFNVEMNAKAVNRFVSFNPNDYANLQVGEVAPFENKNNIYLLIKDQNGDMRILGYSGKTPQQYRKLAEKLGYSKKNWNNLSSKKLYEK